MRPLMVSHGDFKDNKLSPSNPIQCLDFLAPICLQGGWSYFSSLCWSSLYPLPSSVCLPSVISGASWSERVIVHLRIEILGSFNNSRVLYFD